ncbi:hypothetical protein D3C83_137230 [compost metagenome]
MIALEAVVAGEVALERRQQGDVQFGSVARDRGQVVGERLAVVIAARGHKSLVDQHVEGVTGSAVEGPGVRAGIEQRRDIL